MQITTIIAKESPYCGAKAKIHRQCPDERVELFLIEEEIIIEVPLSYIATDNSKVYKPKSRKDFYEQIQNQKNNRKDLIATLNYLVSANLIVPSSPEVKGELIFLLEDANQDRDQIIQAFRDMRDAGKFEFKLANNSGFHPHKKNYRR